MYRNEESPFKGIDTLMLILWDISHYTIEMKKARLRALTPELLRTHKAMIEHRNEESPFKGIDTILNELYKMME